MEGKVMYFRLNPVTSKIVLIFLVLLTSFLYGQDSTGTVTDVDSNVYKTVKIGNQWWMAENLKVTHYRNGDKIPNITDNTDWSHLASGAYCSFDNDEGNVATYGCLYNYYAVTDNRNIAPIGWHVPGDAEWKILIKHCGGASVAGNKMKEAGTEHWYESNPEITNESGFSALPGGLRLNTGAYFNIFFTATFWTSTEKGSANAWHWNLFYNISKARRQDLQNQYGISVRCLRD